MPKTHLSMVRNRCARLAIAVIAGLSLIAGVADAQMPFVSPMFGSNMILQRGKTNNIWGWARPGETIRVELDGQIVVGVAGASGRWQVQLQPLIIGQPLTLRISGPQTVVNGNKLGEFSVAGDDGKWFWACAKIDGDSVIVSSSDVPRPKAARYAWQSNPEATLFNGAGLPAVPFRTGAP
ncbi:MAG TPA: hypothetical protein VIK53_08860 [Verrucomicrobiae bacterium]